MESSEQTDDGSTGSSSDRDALVERVIAARDTGLELEYDLSKPTKQDRDVQWQFPVRVLKPSDGGPLRLLNAAELQGRADRWLKRAKLPRTACGRCYFTWNAFRIECDPQSIIPTIAAFDIQPADLRDGALYRTRLAREPARLTRKSSGPDGSSYGVELAIDPDTVRRDRVEADIALAEITKDVVTRDDAIRKHAAEEISGRVTITFDADADGKVRRRTTVTNLKIRESATRLLTRTTTEIIERRLVSRRKA